MARVLLQFVGKRNRFGTGLFRRQPRLHREIREIFCLERAEGCFDLRGVEPRDELTGLDLIVFPDVN